MRECRKRSSTAIPDFPFEPQILENVKQGTSSEQSREIALEWGLSCYVFAAMVHTCRLCSSGMLIIRQELSREVVEFQYLGVFKWKILCLGKIHSLKMKVTSSLHGPGQQLNNIFQVPSIPSCRSSGHPVVTSVSHPCPA